MIRFSALILSIHACALASPFSVVLAVSNDTAHIEWHGASATNYALSTGTDLNTFGSPKYLLGTNGPLVELESATEPKRFWKVEELPSPQGVGVRDGQLVRYNAVTESFEPFRAFGVNYYDAFLRTIKDGSDTTYEEGLAYLAAHHIPVCRVLGAGFWPADWSLYFSDRTEYFQRLDAFVESAEINGVGLILSLFWNTTTPGEIVDEAVAAGILVPGVDFVPPDPLNLDINGQPTYAEYKSALGRVDSGTVAFIRHYTAEIVGRYGRSPAVWGWEFGNEYNLVVDHPNVASMRDRSGGVAQGMFLPDTTNDFTVLPKWSGPDDLVRAEVAVAKQAFAETVRSIDTWRLIMSGDSRLRTSAYNNWQYHTWTKDTVAEAAQVLPVDNPAGFDTVTAHIYPAKPGASPEVYFSDAPVSMDWETGDYEGLMSFFVTNSTVLGKTAVVGEWGAIGDGTTEDEKTTFHRMMQALIDSGVQLSLLWTFDTRNAGQEGEWWIHTGEIPGWPATPKLYQITNDDPDLWDLEQVNLLFNP